MTTTTTSIESASAQDDDLDGIAARYGWAVERPEGMMTELRCPPERRYHDDERYALSSELRRLGFVVTARTVTLRRGYVYENRIVLSAHPETAGRKRRQAREAARQERLAKAGGEPVAAKTFEVRDSKGRLLGCETCGDAESALYFFAKRAKFASEGTDYRTTLEKLALFYPNATATPVG